MFVILSWDNPHANYVAERTWEVAINNFELKMARNYKGDAVNFKLPWAERTALREPFIFSEMTFPSGLMEYINILWVI